jgi:hypothetical protein
VPKKALTLKEKVCWTYYNKKTPLRKIEGATLREKVASMYSPAKDVCPVSIKNIMRQPG